MLTPTRFPVRPLSRRPTVSVVIPNYNYEMYLPYAVHSALDQSGVDVRVLVIDNASTDDSVARAEKIAAEDSRVRVIRHAQNEGTIYSFNEGLRESDGEYHVLLCSDDLLTPGSLARSAALMEAHPSVGLTYGYAKSFGTSLPPVESTVRGWSVWPGQQWMRARYRDARNVIVTPEVMMRRTVLEQVGYDTRYRERSDLLQWLRASLICDVGRVHGPCQGLQRVHDRRLSTNEYAGMLFDLNARLRVFDLVLDENAAQLPTGDRMRADLHRALALESLRLARRCHDRDEPVGGSSAEEYVEFAVQTWPQIRRTRAWQGYRLRRDGRAPAWWRSGAEQTHRVQHHLRWRLWRRYGI